MEAATANGARGGRGTPRGRGGPPGGRGFRGGGGNSPGGRGFGRGRGGPPGGRGFGGGPPGGRGFRGGPPGGRGFRGARGNSPGGRGFGRGRGGPPGGHGFGRGRGNSPGGRGFGRGRGGPPRGRGFGRGQGHHPEGVDLSKNALEYPQILTKPVKLYIMPSCLTPSLKITNVPVNNFATQFEELKRFLFNILKGPCTISSEAELVFFYQKNLRGLWEVIFAFNSDRGRPSAVKALSVIHGKVFQSHHLIAERFDTLLEDDSLVTENCVRVSNLSTETTEEMLWQLFESCGKLGMIYLNRLQEDSLEALVNFEKPDSVTEALKLDGAKLDNSSINVVHLDWNQSIRVHMPNELTENQLNVELKDFKPTFIRIISSKNKIAFVYFPTKKLYTKAVTTLNETGFLGNKDCVTPAVEHKVVTRLFGAAGLPVSPVKLVSSFQSFGAIKKHHHHPRVHGAFVIVFDSKQAADDAIKASPVLVDGVPCPVSDSAYNLPPVIKKKQMRENLENTKKELEEGDSEEEEDNDDEDDDDDDDDEQELLEEEEDDEAVDEEEEEDDNEEEEDDDDEGEDGDDDEDEEESEESMDASNGVEATHKQPPSQINLKRKGAPNNRGQKKKMPKIN